jgi:hypothetical protein
VQNNFKVGDMVVLVDGRNLEVHGCEVTEGKQYKLQKQPFNRPASWQIFDDNGKPFGLFAHRFKPVPKITKIPSQQQLKDIASQMASLQMGIDSLNSYLDELE